MARALVLMVIVAFVGACGSSGPANSPLPSEASPTPSISASASIAPLGYCADFNGGDVGRVMRHVRKGDVLNTDLAQQLADIQTRMLSDATIATNAKAAKAIRSAASGMGTVANGRGR